MDSAARALPLALARAPAPADLLALTKPRIVLMVAITAAAGYALGTGALPEGVRPPAAALRLWVLLHTLLGTALVAGGTSALNQVVERDVDALMRRTAQRPLPAGRLGVRAASVFAWSISALGVAQLALLVNATTAALAALTLGVYVFVYTPLKRRTPLAALVGAVPGALPIVGGWTAAGAPLDARAAALFAVLFVWQLPHVLALGWLLREDYARAGLRMLGIEDADGRRSARQAVRDAAALLPVSLAPAAMGVAGARYFAAALVLGALLLAASVAFARRPSAGRARALFLATLAYLPALLTALVLDRAR